MKGYTVMSEISCKDFFESLPDRFKPEKTENLNATFQFEILGNQGGNWYVAVKEGQCTVGEGKVSSPDLVATISAKDWIEMVTGKLSPQNAFFSGKLAIRGNQNLAFKFASLFF
jgi:putative sterol carrier protein